jgi:hypothetical protein
MSNKYKVVKVTHKDGYSTEFDADKFIVDAATNILFVKNGEDKIAIFNAGEWTSVCYV